MLIDTHCHIDAAIFNETPLQLLEQAQKQGVQYLVLPAVGAVNFDKVRQIAQSATGFTYALGIHPLCVPTASEDDLCLLAAQLQQHITDSQLVAIGEIGLDFFVPALCTAEMRAKQLYFYEAQLKLAKEFNLPALLHVRRSQDQILKYLRRYKGVTGIAHAFNGSSQQAQQFTELGFALGFGGAMTFTRAKQIRRLATELDLSDIVLETDAPDIAPAWLDPKNHMNQYNRPAEIVGIARVLAELRQTPLAIIQQQTTATAMRVLPRLQQWHQQQVSL